MKIVLYDIDRKIPNLALMKLSSFYKSQGYHTQLSKKLEWIPAQRYFASIVFNSEKSLYRVRKLIKRYGHQITVGGTGIDLKKSLSDEIDLCFPDYTHPIQEYPIFPSMI